jgi:hypothetical protein
MNRREFFGFCFVSILATSCKKRSVTISNEDEFRKLLLEGILQGTTVYFREGEYSFYPYISVHGSNLTFKPYKNEKVRILGEVIIHEEYQTWTGFENVGSDWDGYVVDAPYSTIKNCHIHNSRHGIRASSGNDHFLTVRGCVFEKIGAGNPGYEHPIYWNGNGAIIEKNIFRDNYGDFGLHLYSNKISNLVVRNNKFHNQSILVRTGLDLENVLITGNRLDGKGMDVGDKIGIHRNIRITNNIINNSAMRIRNVESGEITGNQLSAKDRFLVDYKPIENNLIWNNNIYRHNTDYFAHDEVEQLSFEQWQAKYGFDLNSRHIHDNT